jgi:hypothetical protein
MRQTLDDIHGDTVVCTLELKTFRSGVMSVGGSVTDYHYALAMLETAKGILQSTLERRKLLTDVPQIVPAYDTALVGTPHEKALLKARDELSDAM